MQSPSLRLAFAIAAVLSLSTLAQTPRPVTAKVITPAPEKYLVKFGTPDQVGAQFRMTAKQHEKIRSKSSMLGKVLQEEATDSVIELVAVATVLKVSANSVAQKESLVVERFVKTERGTTRLILPKGTVVTAVAEGARVNFYVKGRRLSESVRETLDGLVGMDNDDMRDDAMLETATPKAVGESWPIDKQKAVASMRRMKISVAPQNIRGTVKLEGVSKMGAETFLAVASSIQVTGFAPPLPPGTQLVNSDLKSYLSCKLPVNLALLPPDQLTRVSMAFVMKGKPDPRSPEITVNVLGETTISVQLESLGSAPAPPKTVASAVK